jgi:F-type H+-transporting ATPase subunit delta
MSARRFARPYAEALLTVAGSTAKAAEVRDELARLAALMVEVPALQAAVANPVLPLPAKKQAIDKVADRLGMSPLARRVVGALLARHRLARLDELVVTLGDILDRRQGIGVADVVTAEPLSDEEKRELQAVLERRVGKRLQIRATVDPRLLAGFVAQVDSQLFDGSLRGQLDRLSRELAGLSPSGAA